MPKPRKDAQEALLEAGRALIEEKGVSALSVRAAARRSGVNLGLFHYYFKSKEAFTSRVLERAYERFFAALTLETDGPGDPLERLTRALTVIGRFGRDNRRLMMTIMEDAMRGGTQTLAFAKANMPRHVVVLGGLLEDCWRQGLLERVPLPVALGFLLSGVSAPNCIVSMVERAKAKRPFGLTPAELERVMLSDQTLELRARLLVRGLERPRGGA